MAAGNMSNGKITLQDSVSGFGATLQSGTLSGDVVHTLPKESGSLVGDTVINTFTAPQRSNITTDNDLSFDLAVTNKFKCTPTASGTLTFTNLATQSGSIILNNTGAYAISLGAMVKAKGGLATTLSIAGIYIVGYECDGTTVYLTSSSAMV